MQFYAYEIARNRHGINDWVRAAAAAEAEKLKAEKEKEVSIINIKTGSDSIWVDFDSKEIVTIELSFHSMTVIRQPKLFEEPRNEENIRRLVCLVEFFI